MLNKALRKKKITISIKNSLINY